MPNLSKLISTENMQSSKAKSATRMRRIVENNARALHGAAKS